jgi:hypothetical protein
MEHFMPDYISELKCFGTSDLEFGEIAAPTGTDVSSHRLVFYQSNGTIYNTVSLWAHFPDRSAAKMSMLWINQHMVSVLATIRWVRSIQVMR